MVNGIQVGGVVGAPADGSTQGVVVIELRDANGVFVPGKTVTLAAKGGSSAQISTANSVSNVSNGSVAFTITDKVAESVTLTATDTSDGITLNQTVTVPFVTPAATSAGLSVFPSQATADGMTPIAITVTLEDTLGCSIARQVRAAPQTGSSTISGPDPPVTNSSGQIQFSATDTNNESITYSAVDVTDNNVPFPTTVAASFNNSPAAGCALTQTAGPGFVLQPYATGFLAQSFEVGEIQNTCGGPYGMAWDSSGNLYASDQANGNLYKIPPGGGVANGTTVLANIGQSLSGLAIDSAEISTVASKRPARRPIT